MSGELTAEVRAAINDEIGRIAKNLRDPELTEAERERHQGIMRWLLRMIGFEVS